MLNLVKKDFKVGLMFLPGVSAIVLFVTMVSLLTMFDEFGGLVIAFFVPMTFVLSLGSSFLFISIDEVFRADILYISLPVKRWKVVAARYFTSFLMTLLSLALVVGASYAMLGLLGKTDPLLQKLIGLRGIFGMILLLLLFLAIELPFTFKFGSLKGSGAALAALTGLALLGQLASSVLRALRGMFTLDVTVFTGFLEAVRSWVLGLRAAEAYGFFLAVVLIVVSASLGLSVRLFQGRDF